VDSIPVLGVLPDPLDLPSTLRWLSVALEHVLIPDLVGAFFISRWTLVVWTGAFGFGACSIPASPFHSSFYLPGRLMGMDLGAASFPASRDPRFLRALDIHSGVLGGVCWCHWDSGCVALIFAPWFPDPAGRNVRWTGRFAFFPGCSLSVFVLVCSSFHVLNAALSLSCFRFACVGVAFLTVLHHGGRSRTLNAFTSRQRVVRARCVTSFVASGPARRRFAGASAPPLHEHSGPHRTVRESGSSSGSKRDVSTPAVLSAGIPVPWNVRRLGAPAMPRWAGVLLLSHNPLACCPSTPSPFSGGYRFFILLIRLSRIRWSALDRNRSRSL